MTKWLSVIETDSDDAGFATLIDKMDYSDLNESQDSPITVVYNQIDLAKSDYNFNQPFFNNEANLYFQRMSEFAGESINSIIDNVDYKLHFHKSDIKGRLKEVLDKIDKRIAKANPLIYHFALDPDCKVTNANREQNVRNPRIYFMVGYNGMIHILFFDPYHELNPDKK